MCVNIMVHHQHRLDSLTCSKQMLPIALADSHSGASMPKSKDHTGDADQLSRSELWKSFSSSLSTASNEITGHRQEQKRNVTPKWWDKRMSTVSPAMCEKYWELTKVANMRYWNRARILWPYWAYGVNTSPASWIAALKTKHPKMIKQNYLSLDYGEVRIETARLKFNKVLESIKCVLASP